MAESIDNTGGMRPAMGQTTMVLPVTFDYTGGRRDQNKSRIVWAVIVGVIGVLIGLGIFFSKDGSMLTNMIFGSLVIFIFSLVVRFAILREGKIRKDQISLVDSDYKQDVKSLWGIYSIDDQYPYYCRFRNGKSGIFVRLNKDVILGKYSESEFEHHEAIGDAYNLAGSSRVQMCHVDYMDNVGTDGRLEDSFIRLSDVRNPDLKDVLTDIFAYQQEQMMERVTTFDVYAFLWTGSDINAWSTIQRILGCFMEANYRSYHILNSSDLRELPKTLFNFHDFSVLEAMSSAFSTTSYTGIVPIKVINSDGSEEILGKTVEEKEEERKLQMREQELKKQEIKRRKASRGKRKKIEDEEINLFDD